MLLDRLARNRRGWPVKLIGMTFLGKSILDLPKTLRPIYLRHERKENRKRITKRVKLLERENEKLTEKCERTNRENKEKS